jgi:TRAP-type C4-dicarboxylate transport system substrate-binding protein
MSIIRKLRTGALAGLVGITMAAGTAHADTTTLTVANWLPRDNPVIANGLIPWMKQVEEASDGRLKLIMLPKAVAPAAAFDTVEDGIADISWSVHGYKPGRFNLMEIAGLPFLANNAQSMGIALDRIYRRHFEKFGEHGNMKLLGAMAGSPGYLHVIGTIDTVDDISGLKIRVAGGGVQDTVQALGAVPVQKPVTELYELMSTGIVDGAMAAEPIITIFNLNPVVKTTLKVPGGFYNLSHGLFMNQDKYDSLAPEDQEAIMSVSGEHWAQLWGKAYDDAAEQSEKDGIAAGRDIVDADGELLAAIKERLAGADERWIAVAKESGLEDPAAVLEELRAEIAKIEASQ